MRILWVKVGGLWPPTTGGRLRSVHILAELAQRHHVTLVTTHADRDDPRGLAGRLPGCEIVSVPYSAPKQGSAGFAAAVARSWLSPLPVDLWRWRVPAVRAEVARRLSGGAVDLCVADFLTAAPNVPATRAPVVLFEHNVEHVIWRRLAEVEGRWWRRALLEVEWRKMRRCEAAACRGATLSLAVSDVDGAALGDLAPGARVVAIPTGVDTAYFHPNGVSEQPAGLAFVGSMDWYPNEDAVLHFLDTVWPRVRQEVPEASFTVVGRNPSARLRAVAGSAPGVALTGTVDDVRPHVERAAVCVVPLRIGGGTRLKILEALAMAKAVVATPVGAEGLPLVDGRHFVAAEAPEAFAGAVVSLLRDPVRRAALGTQGRQLVEQRHCWAQVAREFEERLKEGVA